MSDEKYDKILEVAKRMAEEIRAEVDTEPFDELVHEYKAAEASNINNEGVESQFIYILSQNHTLQDGIDEINKLSGIKIATYVSVWDGTEVRSACKYNPQTKTCYDIEDSDIEIDGTMDEQFVELQDGTKLGTKDGVTFDY